MPGYVQFKRWEWFMMPRVYPTGDRKPLYEKANLVTGIGESSNKNQNPNPLMSGSWNLLGPVNTIPNGGGCGRLNCVRIDPTNSNTLYVGAPAGGMWKSVNGGATWNTTTDNLASIGVSDVAIDPTNPNIIYIATGDNDAGDTYTIGVLKSTDGGQTWSQTGLTYSILSNSRVTRLLIHPTSPNILYASSGQGVFKTTNGGVNWHKIFSTSIKDMEFKPGDPNTIYICSSSAFFRSTNGGNNFYMVSNGLPGANSSRLAIAVTPDDPNYVYVLSSKSSNNSFNGVYLSTNSGSSFTVQSTSPNLLGWAVAGNDAGGQGWYTLSIAVNPTNKNEVIVGGVNIWKSQDAGVSWTLEAHWYGGGGKPYVHADIHDLVYLNGSTYYVASDGGIDITTNNGQTFTDLSAGLQIAQMYKLGVSVTNPNLVLTGWQDNGTNMWNAGSWSEIYGGDGMECFVDWSNPNYMYAETQNGGLVRSSNGGLSFNNISGGIPEPGAWVTPWTQDPQASATIYAGFHNVWKSTDRGNNWTAISNFGSSGLTILKVAPSNPQVIYAGSGSILYKTTNGGTTWTNLGPTLPPAAFLNEIAIHANDPNKIWAVFGGYNANAKVFKSSDGGATWTNLQSSALPNVPALTIVSQTGTNDGVYVGTDNGVYYYDETLQTWTPFMNGLPNVIVDELEIHYGTGKLRAATYGRGLWETNLYNPSSTAPVANFSANVVSGCPGLTVQFTDNSFGSPTSWNWSFPGGTPSASILPNPIVTYNNPGSYNDVKLIVGNLNGSDSIIRYSYISISPNSTPQIYLTNNDTICQGQQLLLISSSGVSYSWSPGGQANHLISPSASGSYAVTVTDIFGCVSTSSPVNILIHPAAPPVSINPNGDTLCSSSASGNQWYFNGAPIPGSNQTCHVVTQPGNYYVVATDSNGCTAVSNTLVGIMENASANTPGFTVFPNPAPKGAISLQIENGWGNNVIVEISGPDGRLLYSLPQNNLNGRKNLELKIPELPAGVYLLSLKGDKFTAVKKLTIQ